MADYANIMNRTTMNTECLSAALAVQEKKGQYFTPASALRALRPNDAIIKSLLLTRSNVRLNRN
jgi:hypothetical protein